MKIWRAFCPDSRVADDLENGSEFYASSRDALHAQIREVSRKAHEVEDESDAECLRMNPDYEPPKREPLDWIVACHDVGPPRAELVIRAFNRERYSREVVERYTLRASRGGRLAKVVVEAAA